MAKIDKYPWAAIDTYLSWLFEIYCGHCAWHPLFRRYSVPLIWDAAISELFRERQSIEVLIFNLQG
jgi:hypothetical protein